MPKTVEESLKDLSEALEAANIMRRKLHEDIQDAKAVVKNQKVMITEAIINEVTAQIKALTVEARMNMEDEVTYVIDHLRDDWRKKLGLDT